MRGIARLFGAIMLVVGMLASTLVPVFAQDEPTAAPVEQVQPTEVMQPTEVDVAEPTEAVEPTQGGQPTGPEGAQPTQEVVAPTPTEDEGDFQPASIRHGTLTFVTSDGGNIPRHMTITITDVTDGGSTPVMTTSTFSSLASGQSVGLEPYNAIPDGATILVEVSADGYLPFSQPYTLGDENFTITVYLEAVVAQVYPTLTITTEGGGDIPAGTLIQVINTSDDDALVYGEGVAVDTPSGKVINVPPVDEGSDLEVVITGATGYFDLDQQFTVTPANSAMAVTLQSSQVYSTLTITTSDGGEIPAGSQIQVLNTSDGDTLVYGEGVATDTPSGKVVNVPPVTSGSVLEVVISSANGYQDLDQTFAITTANTTMAVELQEVPPTTGTVNLTVTTADGGAIPTGTILTIGGVSYVVSNLGEVSAADAASGTVFTFTEVPAGTQPITATNAAPYADAAGAVAVEAGSTVDAAILLRRTVEPTVTPSPTVSPTSVPAEPTATAQPTQAPGQPTAVPQKPGKPGGTSTISALPNTGQGGDVSTGMNSALLALAAALLLAGVAGVVGVRTRRQ